MLFSYPVYVPGEPRSSDNYSIWSQIRKTHEFRVLTNLYLSFSEVHAKGRKESWAVRVCMPPSNTAPFATLSAPSKDRCRGSQIK